MMHKTISCARSPRHWSYGLLVEPEKATLRALRLFTGGFTLELASDAGALEWLWKGHAMP